MKIPAPKYFARRDRGMATILFIALLAIMVALVAANLHALARLHREVKLLEQQQTERLAISQTNAIAVTNTNSK
ncbi:MAG TPA: hypothetical protein VGI03_06815 [Verrucomicrobiae bacterium]|jgi:hypothetical protein